MIGGQYNQDWKWQNQGRQGTAKCLLSYNPLKKMLGTCRCSLISAVDNHGLSLDGPRCWSTPSESIYWTRASDWLYVTCLCLAARELKEGCSDARLSKTTNVLLYLLMNIVIHSAVVNILMHCVSKIYEPDRVSILHYDRYCQITFH